MNEEEELATISKDPYTIDTKVFESIPLFSALTEDEVEAILAFAPIKKFDKNTHLFLEGDSYDGFYIVLKGSIKVYKLNQEGKEFVMHLLHPYSLLADVPMFEGGNYPGHAIATENSLLLFVPQRPFLEFLDHSPALLRKMLGGFAKKIRTLTNRLEDLTLHDVSCRLARYLIDSIEESTPSAPARPILRLNSTKSVLASQLGTISETLYRTFKKLQSDGIIRTSGRTVTILDYTRLRTLAEYRIHP